MITEIIHDNQENILDYKKKYRKYSGKYRKYSCTKNNNRKYSEKYRKYCRWMACITFYHEGASDVSQLNSTN